MQNSSNGRAPLFSVEDIAGAEAALASMSDNFQLWLNEEIQKLGAARFNAQAHGWSDVSLGELLVAAHDVKGLGATYDYPLATELAASLCKLLETPEGKRAARANTLLIDAHVDAIRACERDGIRSADDPVGCKILRTLERRVDALNIAPA
ncbi:MAG: Hpt domain-containing protein [Caulobacterales bacterium]